MIKNETHVCWVKHPIASREAMFSITVIGTYLQVVRYSLTRIIAIKSWWKYTRLKIRPNPCHDLIALLRWSLVLSWQSPTTNLTRPLTINPNDYKMPSASRILIDIALAEPSWSQISIPVACTGGVTIARVQGHDTAQQGANLRRPYFVTLPTIRL